MDVANATKLHHCSRCARHFRHRLLRKRQHGTLGDSHRRHIAVRSPLGESRSRIRQSISVIRHAPSTIFNTAVSWHDAPMAAIRNRAWATLSSSNPTFRISTSKSASHIKAAASWKSRRQLRLCLASGIISLATSSHLPSNIAEKASLSVSPGPGVPNGKFQILSPGSERADGEHEKGVGSDHDDRLLMVTVDGYRRSGVDFTLPRERCTASCLCRTESRDRPTIHSPTERPSRPATS